MKNRTANALDIEIPHEAAVLAELKDLRRRGIAKLGQKAVPALETCVVGAGHAMPTEDVTSFMVEQLIGEVLAKAEGHLAETVSTLLGMAPGTRGDTPTNLRSEAAAANNVSVDHFRKTHEVDLLGQTSQLLLREVHAYRMRLAKMRLDLRTPVGSRLGVEWLRRFEAYYRIWTPVSGVASDLTAARSTMLEEPKPWDEIETDDGEEPHSQQLQSEGFAEDAFGFYAAALYAERQFQIGFGGLWLLPEASAEDDLAGAMQAIRLASPINTRLEGFLCDVMGRTDGQSVNHFLVLADEFEDLRSAGENWIDWVATCDCSWELGSRPTRSHFPTAATHPGISANCDVHRLVSACNDYMLIVDDSWDLLADWYDELPFPVRTNETAEQIYAARPDPLPANARCKKR